MGASRLCFTLLLVAATHLMGCATASRGTHQLDPLLVLPYMSEMEKGKTLPEPYVVKYSDGDKTLLYVLADHLDASKLSDPPNEDATLKTIARLFADYRIEGVVVEGIDPWAGELPSESLLNKIRECEESQFRSGCSESSFAMSLALKHKAAVISGEPTQAKLKRAVHAAGFTDWDLIYFYLVRVIPQWKRQGQWDPVRLEGKIETQLKRYKSRIGSGVEVSFDDFIAWYSKHMKGRKPYTEILAGDTGPHGGKDATYVQKISHQVGLARDRGIVENIGELLTKQDTVLVVYGGSHYLTQKPALDRYFGTSGETLKLY